MLCDLQDRENRLNDKLRVVVGSTATDESESDPLLNREIVMNMNHVKEWPRRSCGRMVSGTIFSSHPTMFVLSVFAICFCVCIVLLHPYKVSHLAVSLRRSLLACFR